MHADNARYRLGRVKRSLAARLALLSPRFHCFLPAASSFEQRQYRWDREGDRLMVFLPGIDDLAEDFERRGFVESIRRQGVAAGAIAVDAHYGYYAARTLHDLLVEDVLVPARSQGYRKVWMTGISLGGFGAASFAAAHPEKLGGLVLLAPYLGEPALIREIASAGGVERWEPGEPAADEHARRLWAWLKRAYVTDVHTDPLPLYLGYGAGDRFADAHRLLAQLLPPENLCAIPGGHDWNTWSRVWSHFMQRKDTMFV